MNNLPLNIFCLIVGRFPVWMLLIGLVISHALSLKAFIVLFLAIVLARGYLYTYESRHGFITLTLYSVIRHIVKPVLFVIMIEVSYFAVTYALLQGTMVDKWLLLAAFGCVILSFAAGIHAKKPAIREDTVLKRTTIVRLLIFLLWVYFLIRPDGIIAGAATVLLIYTLEYFSTFPLNNENTEYQR